MALRTDSMGSLLQGVSLQPDRIKLPGQVRKQVNLVSNVTTGLTTRPGSDEIGPLVGASPAMRFHEINFKGTDYIIGYQTATLKFWRLNGNPVNMQFLNGSENYIGTRMRFHVVDNQIFMANREVICRKVTGSADGVPWRAAIFHALGGQFLKTYTVRLRFSNGANVTASYQTPDGTGPTDAEQTASEFIVSQLQVAIDSDINLPADTVTEREGDVVLIFHPTLSIDITVEDGESGTILRAVSDQISEVTDLPRFAPNGMVVKVLNGEADEDDYYLKFDAKGVTSENGSSGFGREGSWVETRNPEQDNAWNLSTMPHVIEIQGGVATVDQGDWIARPVGDNNSAPYASIENRSIRDIGGFEERLVMLTKRTVVMSRTNKPFDLWRESATQVVATDPIDMSSTSDDDPQLDWIVPFNTDLLVFADPGRQQYLIQGGGLTPTNRSLVLVTSYEVESNDAKPVSTGRTVIFPFKAGVYSGLSEYYTPEDVVSNTADNLSETQDTYMSGEISQLEVSANFKTVLAKLSGESEQLTVYKYLRDNSELIQSSWSKWKFQDRILATFFKDSEIFLISHSVTDGIVYMHKMDMNKPETGGYHLTLDRKVKVFSDNSVVIAPFRNARFQQGRGCSDPGRECSVKSSLRLGPGIYQYTLPAEVAPDEAELIAGAPVEWELEPPQPQATNRRGDVDTSRKITVDHYTIDVSSAGEFYGVFNSKYADPEEYIDYLFPLDDDPEDNFSEPTYTGEVNIPWGERADYSFLTLKGNDIRPVTIIEIKWNGQILNTKGSSL